MSVKYQITEPMTFYATSITGASRDVIDRMVDDFAAQVPQDMATKIGMPVTATREVISAGGLFKKGADTPALIISSDENPKYAKVLLIFKLVGAVLNFTVAQYGDVSKNYQRARAGKLLGNQDAYEAESMFYQGVSSVSQELINSYKA